MNDVSTRKLKKLNLKYRRNSDNGRLDWLPQTDRKM